MTLNPLETIFEVLEWKPTKIRWHPRNGTIPHVTHHGIIKIGNARLRAIRLSNERLIAYTESMHQILGVKSK